MRENGAFPDGTDLKATIDQHFQCCSITVDAPGMATGVPGAQASRFYEVRQRIGRLPKCLSQAPGNLPNSQQCVVMIGTGPVPAAS